MKNGVSPQQILDEVKAFGLDELNANYFRILLKRHFSSGGKRELRIFEAGKANSEFVAYPTAIAPAEMLGHLPCTAYQDLLRSKESYLTAASHVALWVKKMQAGTGSSIERTRYLSRHTGLPLSQIKLGSKGTDLFVTLPETKETVSLAEAQILQSVAVARRKDYAQLILQDIIGGETGEAVEKVWRRSEARVRETSGMERLGEVRQAYLPTVMESGELTTERRAPGGHALFGLDALAAATREALRPNTHGRPLVAVIANGEDLCSFPDPLMVGWMVEKKIPIVMVTTEKTEADIKGGQIAVVKEKSGAISIALIESAQAKAVGQQTYFEKLGVEIRRDGQPALFNTNMALFNYDVLSPKLGQLVKDIGESRFFELCAPDLITNWKEQPGSDGKPKRFLQLEGALGSSLLNLVRYWREHYREPLVYFIKVVRERRSQIFSPIKSAFDYFMQFHSDRFQWERETLKLKHLRGGDLPSVSLSDPYYADVENVLEAFSQTSVLALNALQIEGKVLLPSCLLRGKVKITNRGKGLVNLTELLLKTKGWPLEKGRPIIEDRNIAITPDGGVAKE